MIYQRNSNFVLTGKSNHEFKAERFIQEGFKKYIKNGEIICSTHPIEDFPQSYGCLEWSLEAEKNLLKDFDQNTFNKVIKDISNIEDSGNFQYILRQKSEIFCLDMKKSAILKYELKIIYCKDKERIIMCCGGNGAFDDLINKKFFYKDLQWRISNLSYSLINMQFSGNIVALLGNQATGFLCHEAVGHLAEGDMVVDGAAFYGKLGKKLFDSRISIVDNGNVKYGAGNIEFDEEGTPPGENYIVRKGKLCSYLTDNKIAEMYGIKNTGNRRSSRWDQPSHIRMTNTYMLGGDRSVEEIISSIKFGVYLVSVTSGSCNLDGSFLISSNEALLIINGSIEGRIKSITINDTVFSVLNNIYAIGKDSRLCLGTSICGKGGNLKVDAGGPHILAKVNAVINNEFK